MTYFKNYPLIRYNNRTSLNLLLRAKIITEVFNRYEVYYTYVVKDSETPDYLAWKFYSDPELDWVIYYANEIVDPIHDWPLSSRNLDLFIEAKYNKKAYETKGDILHYTYTGLSNESEEDIKRKSYIMSKETYDLSSEQERSGWSPLYVYDYEFQKNEAKRKIRILDSSYIPMIKSELSKIFNVS